MEANPSSWSLLSMKKRSNTKTSVLSPNNIVLDCVVSYNIEMQIRHANKAAKILLSGVPGFLVEAFNWLERNGALDTQGLFRKEGNINRIRNPWKTLCGLTPIPSDCHAHDVCSLIKRFFREITTPIFNDSQSNLMKFADTIRDEKSLLNSLLTVIERLPESYISTLAFLMRNLKKVSEHSENNMMTVENLATVFAPTLFRDELMTRSFSSSHGYSKNKRGLEQSLLNLVRQRNDRQITIIKLLIQHSDFIRTMQIYRIPCESEEDVEDKARLQRKPALVLPTILETEEPRDTNFLLEEITKAMNAELNEETSAEASAELSAEPTVSFGESEKSRDASNFLPTEITQEITEARKTTSPPPMMRPALSVSQDSECMEERIKRAKISTSPMTVKTTSGAPKDSDCRVEHTAKAETLKLPPPTRLSEAGDFKNSENLAEQITNAKSAEELPFAAPAPSAWSNRPSVAYFRQHNKGFVQQRRAFFSNLS